MRPVAGEPSVSETHVSTVFFSADRAYKLLKPIRTSFLDHTSVASRLQAADDEIALNRRMAPDVYLGSADVVERGEVVDRMIVMRRLPAERRLTAVLGSAEADDCLRAIARRVAAFHAAEPPAPDGADVASRDAVWQNWADNLRDLAAVRDDVVPGAELDRVEHLVERYLRRRRPLFDARIDGGFVRDGHGDLTAEDIFCTDRGPQILDCLAFARRLRVADVLADVAFLAMDVERLADVELAARFLDWYSEFSNEHHPPSLADHYIAYRANVRAKVAAIRHQQGATDVGAELLDYHRLCLRHLERSRIRLILVGGSPGTGKTTVARAIAGPMAAMVLSTDDLRKDLAGRGHLDRELSPPDGGIYSPTMTERTYDELLDRAGRLLELGQSVVLDASWNRDRLRRQAVTVATEAGAELAELQCDVGAEAAKTRVAERLATGLDPSDARPELIDELRSRFEPWPTATRLDTSRSIAETTAAALDHLLGSDAELAVGTTQAEPGSLD